MIWHLLTVLVGLAFLWIGTDLVINSMQKMAVVARLSEFIIAFFLLGTVSSLPEMSLAINPVTLGTPEVAIGNLIGGQLFILLGIIPALVLLAGPMEFGQAFQGKMLSLTLLVTLAPLLALLNNSISLGEALLLGVIYVIFSFVFQSMERSQYRFSFPKRHTIRLTMTDFLLFLAGLGLIFFSSGRIVVSTTWLAEWAGLSSFFVSFLLLAIGTNLPELSVAVKSLYRGKKEIVLGHFVGSASLNTLIFALVVISNGSAVYLGTSVLAIVGVGITGLFFLWWFAHNDSVLRRFEAVLLLALFVLVVSSEWISQKFL